MGIHIPSKCINLEMVDGKPFCKIHDTRPGVCRNYFCEKVIAKALQGVANGLCI
jgi:Fe-S-cluster containining protein